jgi:hypothetical protein
MIWLMEYVKSFRKMLVSPDNKKNEERKGGKAICVVSKRAVKEAKRAYGDTVPHEPSAGVVARNELDTHADTCCAGANWKLMETTNEVCEVTPFLDSYEPVKEVMVGRCCTVWTSPDTGREFLLVGDQMLWFGT